MTYKVSIIVPVYNVASYIDRCACALFEQSLEGIEYIFVNDCSPDNSLQILQDRIRKYPHLKEHIKIVSHQENKGLPAARNTGMGKASGEFIFHCDSDDWIDSDAIKRMYDQIIKENADILWTDFYFSFKDKEVLQKESGEEKSVNCIKAMMSEKMHGAVWNKLYRHTLFIDYNVKFPDGKAMWEDLYTNIHLFHFAKKVTYLPIALYHYNQENINSIGRDLSEKKINDIIYNANEIIRFLTNQAFETYRNDFNFLKLAAKQTLLFSCDIYNFYRWEKLYPESNRYIMQFKALPLHLRCIGWASANHLWPLINFWIYIKKIKHRS